MTSWGRTEYLHMAYTAEFNIKYDGLIIIDGDQSYSEEIYIYI